MSQAAAESGDEPILISPPGTQFVLQDGDEEALWEVIEITAEKSTKYKVKWAGTDPATGKPWPESWVLKHDCTDQLVRSWKRAQARKRQRRSVGKKKDSASVASRMSKASSNKSCEPPPRHSTISTQSAPSRRIQHASSSRMTTVVPPGRSTSKRKVSATLVDSDEEWEVEERQEEAARPKKKRKIDNAEMIVPTSQSQELSLHVPNGLADGKVFTPESEEEILPIAGPSRLNRKKNPKAKQATRIPDIFDIIPGQDNSIDQDTNSEDDGSHRLSSFASSRPKRKPTVRDGPISQQIFPSESSKRTQPRSPTQSPPPVDSDIVLMEIEDELQNHDNHYDTFEDAPTLFEPSLSPNRVSLPPSPISPPPPCDDIRLPHRLHADESIVPETETQSSTESQTQASHLSTNVPALIHVQDNPNATTNEGVVINCPSKPDTPSKRPPSLVSLMKSRSSATRVTHKSGAKKHLGPIPIVSPSRFKPFLPLVRDDEESVPSQIEQFSSPLKPSNSATSRVGLKTARGCDDGDDDGMIRRRGEELAAIAAAKKRKERQAQEKRSLNDLLGFMVERTNEQRRGLVDEAVAEEESVVREMEDAYVDLTGGNAGAPGDGNVNGHASPTHAPPIVAFRMEEEETTQDLLRDMALFAPTDIAPSDPPPLDDPTVDTILVPATTGAVSSRSSPQPEPQEKTPSPQPPKSKSPYSLDILELPPTASALLSSPDPRYPAADNEASPDPPTSTNKLALDLLHTKSEEIESLERAVAREQARADGCVEVIRQLEERLAVTGTSAPASSGPSEAERKVLTLEQELAQTAADKAAWEQERGSLKASVDSLTQSKSSTEADLALFREQYASASQFVSTLQVTNTELEERAGIAEAQVRDGLAMVKGFYENRVSSLENDLGKWKGICSVFRLKDERTGDDVRRRAAEAVELEGQVHRLRRELAEMRDTLRVEQARYRRALGRSGVWCEDENEGGFAQGAWKDDDWKDDDSDDDGDYEPDDSDDSDYHDHYAEEKGRSEVHVCMWRSIERGISLRCDKLFESVEDLEAHFCQTGHVKEV